MYSRFEALQKYDLDKLQESTVAVVGLGATGSVIAEHLARHGINLVLIDRDYLEMNDLYSSNLYSRKQCEKALPKVKAVEDRLSDLTEVESYITDLNEDKTDILDSDLIIDGTDNIETRYIIERYSKEKGIPWIYTAALGEKGFSIFLQDKCLKCIFKNVRPKESCETNGIMREISSMAASASTMKAVKYLSGLEVEEKLETIPEMESFELGECNCGDVEAEASQICGENKYQVYGDKNPEDFKGDEIASNKYLRRINLEGNVITVFNSGRAIIEARSLEDAERLYRKASSI